MLQSIDFKLLSGVVDWWIAKVLVVQTSNHDMTN